MENARGNNNKIIKQNKSRLQRNVHGHGSWKIKTDIRHYEYILKPSSSDWNKQQRSDVHQAAHHPRCIHTGL